MQNRITKKIILGISIILITAFVYVYNAKYSLYEITPDNYKTILKENDASLSEAGLDQAISEKFSIALAYNYATSKNLNVASINSTKLIKGTHVEIHSYTTDLNYWAMFTDKQLTSISIFKTGVMNPDSPRNPFIRAMINNLILKEGFLLKRTKLKEGSDIIIKETEDSFIIGSFYSYDAEISSIWLSTYSKKKYL